ncbi:MAG: methyl-accepting chemotaxis protein, partial [Lachnospiraceae bacterium]|nr:methyl-accepting chemotaxis protein [Lachnospiraceae bacterium]
MNKQNVKNRKLIGRIVTIAIIGMILMALILCFISYTEIESSYHTMGEDMLRVSCHMMGDTAEDMYEGEWHLEGDVLYKGDWNMLEDFGGYLTDLKANTGLDYTVIIGKTRRVTTIDGMLGKDISDKVYATVSGGKDYADFKTVIGGKPYYVYYMPIKQGGQIIGSYFSGRPADDINSEMNGKIAILIIFTIVVVIAFVIIGILLSIKYSRLMKEIAENVETLASGDLTLEVDPDLIKRKDELGIIADGVRNLADKLKEVIGNSKAAAGELNNSGTSLADSSSQASQASTQVTDAVSEVSRGAVSQAESVQNAA